MQRRLTHGAGQPGLATAFMTATDRDPGIARQKGDQRGHFVRGTIRLPIAVEGHPTIGRIDRGKMDPAAVRLGLLGRLKIPSPLEAVAAGGPLAGLPFAEDDGVEYPPPRLLQRDHRSAALLQIGQADPTAQGLFTDVLGQRARLEPGPRLGKLENPTSHPRRAVLLARHFRRLESVEPPLVSGLGRDRCLGGDSRNAGRSPGFDRRHGSSLGFDGPPQTLLAALSQTALGVAFDGAVSMSDTVEHRLHPIVIADGNGIELVIVASGAVDRESEEGLAHHADEVVHLLFTGDGPLGGVGLRVARLIPGPGHQHARRDDAVGGDRFEHVAGHLLPHEPVIRKIGIEAADHIVAIRPGVVAGAIVLEPLTLGVAHHIEPMTRPPFSVVG